MSSENYHLSRLKWTFADNTIDPLSLSNNLEFRVGIYVFPGKLTLFVLSEPEIVVKQSVNFIPQASVQM